MLIGFIHLLFPREKNCLTYFFPFTLLFLLILNSLSGKLLLLNTPTDSKCGILETTAMHLKFKFIAD